MYKELRATRPFSEYWFGLCHKDLHKKTTVTYTKDDYIKDISLSIGTFYHDPHIQLCDADYNIWLDCTGMTWEDTATDETMMREYTFTDGARIRLVTDLSKKTHTKSEPAEDEKGLTFNSQ